MSGTRAAKILELARQAVSDYTKSVREAVAVKGATKDELEIGLTVLRDMHNAEMAFIRLSLEVSK